MKFSIKYLSLSAILVYSSFMLYKTPTISDALIVLGMLGFVSGLCILEYKQSLLNGNKNSDLDKLEQELRIERARAAIEEVKFQSVQQQSRRDDFKSGKPSANKFVF